MVKECINRVRVLLRMGLRRESAAGLQQLLELLERLEKEGVVVYVLFCGNRDPQTGDSWCSDCVKGDSVHRNNSDAADVHIIWWEGHDTIISTAL